MGAGATTGTTDTGSGMFTACGRRSSPPPNSETLNPPSFTPGRNAELAPWPPPGAGAREWLLPLAATSATSNASGGLLRSLCFTGLKPPSKMTSLGSKPWPGVLGRGAPKEGRLTVLWLKAG